VVGYLNLELSVVKHFSDIYTTYTSHREAKTLLICCQGVCWGQSSPEIQKPRQNVTLPVLYIF